MEVKVKEFSVKMTKLDTRNRHRFVSVGEKKMKLKFECDLCGYKSNEMHRTRDHITVVHLKIKQLKCEICDWRTSQNSNLTIHMKFKHGPDVKCQICEKILTSHAGLLRHMKNSHENQNGYFCEICKNRFKSYDKLETHMRKNHFHEKESFECDECDKKFFFKWEFNKHRKGAHSKNIKCLFNGCTRIFSQAASMKRHYNNIHLNIRCKKRFKCDLCGHGTYSKNHVIIHMNSKHLQIRPFKCSMCKFEVFAKGDLTRHIKNVHGPTKIKCQTCDQVFKNPHTLKNHIARSHVGIPCAICNQKFQSIIFLKNHIAAEHLNGKGIFKCEFCPKTYDLEIQLMRHKKNVHVEKHKCHFEGCNKVYGNGSQRNTHYKIAHLKIKPKV